MVERAAPAATGPRDRGRAEYAVEYTRDLCVFRPRPASPAARVSADSASRLIGSPKMWDRGAELTSTSHWFETELLTHKENFVGQRTIATLNRNQ